MASVNPHLNKYKSQLAARESDRRELNRNKTLAKVALGVGAVGAAAGAVHTLHPKGLIGALDSVVDEHSRSALRAIKETDYSKHLRGYLNENKTLEDAFGSAKRSVADNYQKILKEEKSRFNELQMEVFRRRTSEAAARAGKDLSDDKLHNRILKNLDGLKTKDPNTNFNKEVDRLKSELSYKLTSLSRQNSSRVGHELKKRDFSNELVSAASKMLEKEGIANAKVDDTAVKNTAYNIKKIAEKELVNKNQKSNNFLNKVLSKVTGYKKASGQDLLKLHNTGDFKLDDDTLKFLRKLNRPDKFVPDNRLFMYGGRLVEGRNAANFLDKTTDFMTDGLLGRMLYLREAYQYKKNNERPVHVMRAGYNLPILENTDLTDAKGVLKETVYGIGDSIYSYSKGDLNKVKSGVHFASGRFGRTRRLMAQMSGVNSPQGRNMIQEALDISKSREPGALRKGISFLKKFDNDEWMPNKIGKMFKSNTIDTSDFYTIEDYLDIYSKGFSDNVLQNLVKGTEFEDLGLSFSTDKDIVDSYKKLTSMVDMNKYDRGIANQFERQFYSLMDSARIVQKTGVMSQNEMKYGVDLIKRDASEILFGELIGRNIKNAKVDEIVDDAGVGVFKQIRSLLDDGTISKTEFNDSIDTLADYMYKDAVKADYGKMRGNNVLNLFNSNSERSEMFEEIVTNMTSRTHSWHSSGPVDDFYDNFHANTIAVNKTFKNIDVSGQDWLDKSFNIAKSIVGLGKGAVTHGRGSMDQVNTLDLFAYGLANAPNEIFKRAEVRAPFIPWTTLGLSDSSLGSTGSTLANMFTKRILPVYTGFQTLKYINDYSNEWDSEGYTINQRFERAKAHTKLTVAKVKDVTGVTGTFKWMDSLTPGSENLEYSMGSIPILGWSARGAGLFSEKSYDEWVDYFATGEDPVRSGRNWILSTGPWMGQGVEYYEPNSYRRAMSEWKYTDTVYGSKDEYWSHQWLPTPRHPLAPVKRLLDPYWFEEMHMKDRPFEVSGAFIDPNTPWGPVFNQTVGRILKPQKRYTTGASKKDREELDRQGSFSMVPISAAKSGAIENLNYIPAGEIQGGSPFVVGDAPEYDEKNGVYLGDIARVPIGDTGNMASNGAGNLASIQEIATINQSIRGQAGNLYKTNISKGYTISGAREFSNDIPEGDIQNPGSIGYNLRQGLYMARGFVGGIGFAASIPFGNSVYGAGEKVLDSADNAYAASNRFVDMNIGGLGGMQNEGFRRFFREQRTQMHVVNNLPNMMPGWMPGEDYFINFKKGDPYSKVGRGEIRLPGAAYESLQPLHSDQFGKYGAVDRAAILADIAPYSKEFELWKQIAQNQDLSEEEKAFLNQALEQSKEQKSGYFLTPYEFLNNPVNKKKATVKKFISPKRFLIEEDDRVYSLAGVDTSFNPETESGMATLNVLQEHMTPGSKIELVAPKHPGEEDIPVAVFKGDQSVNRLLLNSGVSRSSTETPVDNYVFHTAAGRTIGKAWELFAHSKIPIISNKFISVNSPYEHYKDKQVYSKDFQSWSEPVDDFIKPTYQSLFARHPVGATVGGIVPGYIIGRLIAGKRHAGKFAAASAVIAGVGSLVRAKHEMETGKAWIPKEEESERELIQYFDRLEYVKNKRLFEKYKAAAEREEGVDLDKVLKRLDEKEEDVRKYQAGIRTAEDIREKDLSAEDYVKAGMNDSGRLEYEVMSTQGIIADKRSYYQNKIDEFREEEILVGLGPLAQKALDYRDAYESTMYGLADNAGYAEIFAAIPKNEREYFQEFANETDPEKRKEILKLVPGYMKDIYKNMWGEKTEPKDSLRDYFRDYYLPNNDWVGWKEGVSLDHSMYKVADDEGMDAQGMGIWRDYSTNERLTPAPYGVGGSFKDDTAFVRTRLRSVLNDFDLNDIDIEIVERQDQEVNVNFDFEQDVSGSVSNKIKVAMGG
jgi:hypothetical protein